MAHIGIPVLTIEPTSWCRLRTAREHRGKWELFMGNSMADRKFIDEVVKTHNEYRKHHQAPPLSHSNELSAHAQRWANHLAASGSFEHSQVQGLGENIAMKCSSRLDTYTGQEVTDQWYSEIRMHIFGGEPHSLRAGHFTQVVWKGSKEIGVGRAMSSGGRTVVVANYRPPGNVLGMFATNVLPPSEGCRVQPSEPPSRSGKALHFNTRDTLASPESRSESSNERTVIHRTIITSTTSGNRGTTTTTKTCVSRDGSQSLTDDFFKRFHNDCTLKTNPDLNDVGMNSPDNHIQKQHYTHLHTVKTADSSSRSQAQTVTRTFTKMGTKLQECNRFQDTKNETPWQNAANKITSVSGRTEQRKQTISEFREECLKAHNSYRAKHKVPALVLAKDLCDMAQMWAEELAARDRFEHSKCELKGERVGENIAMKWSTSGASYLGREPVDEWYREIGKHDFKSERSTGTGHFTQVVWKGSQELGVGMAMSRGGKAIVVANYRPAGNLVGSFQKNVLPPK